MATGICPSGQMSLEGGWSIGASQREPDGAVDGAAGAASVMFGWTGDGPGGRAVDGAVEEQWDGRVERTPSEGPHCSTSGAGRGRIWGSKDGGKAGGARLHLGIVSQWGLAAGDRSPGYRTGIAGRGVEMGIS